MSDNHINKYLSIETFKRKSIWNLNESISAHLRVLQTEHMRPLYKQTHRDPWQLLQGVSQKANTASVVIWDDVGHHLKTNLFLSGDNRGERPHFAAGTLFFMPVRLWQKVLSGNKKKKNWIRYGKNKRGLDYFPMSSVFMHDRMVRRIMRREGDSAFATLVETLSYIYAGNRYYIDPVGDDFTRSLSTAFTVRNWMMWSVIISLSVNSMTMPDFPAIQHPDFRRHPAQYLFITKRRSSALIGAGLLPAGIGRNQQPVRLRAVNVVRTILWIANVLPDEAVNGDADHKTACTVTSSPRFCNNGGWNCNIGYTNKRKQKNKSKQINHL